MKRNKNRVVVANSKGGVTKTTSLCELAAHISDQGKKVLCVDMDPQANTTSTILGKVPPPNEMTIFDLLVEEGADLSEVMSKGSDNWPSVWVLPANQKLQRAYKFLESEPNWICRLDEIVEQVEHNFHAVLIDTPPAMGMLTKMAIRASNKLLIPTDSSRFSNDGDETVLALVEHIEKKTGHKLDQVKMILTLQQKQGAYATRDAIKFLKEQYEDIFMPVEIPHCIKAVEAQRMHTPPTSVKSLLDNEHKLFRGYQEIVKAMIR